MPSYYCIPSLASSASYFCCINFTKLNPISTYFVNIIEEIIFFTASTILISIISCTMCCSLFHASCVYSISLSTSIASASIITVNAICNTLNAWWAWFIISFAAFTGALILCWCNYISTSASIACKHFSGFIVQAWSTFFYSKRTGITMRTVFKFSTTK